MTDLPQNELFSAYLDGELTAAERAEIEQLLATNPAARQLLDELRALSTTLQSLPHEKLGDDLSRQVLRLAERRMLTEGEPGDVETAPRPLARSVFQRFATRRNAVWLALTACVAIMVLVNEQRQGAKPVQIARQMAPAASEKAREPGPPPTIQAAPDIVADAPAPSDKRAEKKTDHEEPSADMAPATSVQAQSGPATAPEGAVRSEPVRTKRGAMVGKAVKKDLNAQEAERFDKADESDLVVECDISRKAVASQAFDKLLDANGIAQNEQLGQINQERAKDAKQLVTGDQSSAPSEAAANENFVYVEATPAQIAATLAGLTAQPDVFSNVSVKPAQDEHSQVLVRRYATSNETARQTAIVLQGTIQSKTAVRSLAKAKTGKPTNALNDSPATLGPTVVPAFESSAGRQEAKPETTEVVAERPSSPSAEEVPARDAKPAKEQRQLAKQLQPQQLAQSIARQRVLFVMRVVDADQPPAESPAQDK